MTTVRSGGSESGDQVLVLASGVVSCAGTSGWMCQPRPDLRPGARPLHPAGAGRQVRVTDALGHSNSTAYTGDGLVAQTTGEPATQPNGVRVTHVSKKTYDAAGKPHPGHRPCRTDRRHRLLQRQPADLLLHRRPGLHRLRLRQRRQADDGVLPVGLGQDPNNPSGTPTTNTFTADNLLLTSTAPVSGDGTTKRRQTTYGYDGGGRKTAQSTATLTSGGTQDGRRQTFAYSPADRLVSQSGANPGEAAVTVSSSYDAAGNVTRAGEGAAAVTGTYYLDGRPRSVTSGARTAGYAYDGAGRPTGRTTVPAVILDHFRRPDYGKGLVVTPYQRPAGFTTFSCY